ncbi:MAG: hypothetical protein ACJ0G7_00255 [Parasynechococcus sp.]
MAGTFLQRRKVKAATIDGVCADSWKEEALKALAVSSNHSRVLKEIR